MGTDGVEVGRPAHRSNFWKEMMSALEPATGRKEVLLMQRGALPKCPRPLPKPSGERGVAGSLALRRKPAPRCAEPRVA